MYEQFAGYELITLLADGLTGRVHLAQAPGTGHLYAIKEMLLERESALSDDEQKQRFEREVRIHCALEHPNIVKAHGGGVWQDRHYLVLDYQPGSTLQTLMESGRPPMPQVLDWGIQLCSALDYLYGERQLVHRDIKPANLIISPSGQVKMTDFGLARVALHPEITQTKMMLGTIVYMSPEQLLDPTMVDNRADIFAVGAVLFKALTGTLPFAADDVSAMAHRLLYDKPSDPRDFNLAIPESLAQVLLRCLAKDVDDRYLSARSLAADLQRELQNPELYLAQGKIHAGRSEWKDAANCFQQAAALAPSDAEAWFHLGDALERQNHPQPAFDCYLKVIHSDPSCVAAYRRLGSTYLARGQFEAAAKMIDRAWTLDPSDRDTCLDLVSVRRLLGREAEGLELAMQIAHEHPESVRAHLELGRLRYAKGEFDEANAAFRAALRLDPHDYQVLFNLAALLFEHGDLGEAEELFLKAIALDSSRIEAQHNLALLWLQQKRYSEAEEMLRAIVEREPTAARFALLGEALLKSNRYVEAAAILERSVALEPTWIAEATLAEALARCFRYQEAMAALRSAISRAPDDSRAPLHFLYAHMSTTTGHASDATASLRACLAAQPEPEVAERARELLTLLAPRSTSFDLRGKTQSILRGLLSGKLADRSLATLS